MALPLLGMSQDQPPAIHGEIQYNAVAGVKDSGTVAQHHASRIKLGYSSGAWEFTVSYLLYPLYNYNSFDETTIGYQFGSNRIKIGRILPALLQSSWYDQWNSGFIFFPDVERWQYFGTLSPWQTNPGVELQSQLGNSTLTLSAIDLNDLKNDKMFPTRFERQFARFQTFTGNWVLGAATYWDSRNFTDGEHMLAVDFRTSGDHWVWRGEFVKANKYDTNYQGMFTDFAYRPHGQDHVTLLGRYETSKYEIGPAAIFQAGFTLGAKYVLPEQTFLSLNYQFGNIQLRNGFSNGWLFGFQKTITF